MFLFNLLGGFNSLKYIVIFFIISGLIGGGFLYIKNKDEKIISLSEINKVNELRILQLEKDSAAKDKEKELLIMKFNSLKIENDKIIFELNEKEKKIVKRNYKKIIDKKPELTLDIINRSIENQVNDLR
jgi:hypothetical protein